MMLGGRSKMIRIDVVTSDPYDYDEVQYEQERNYKFRKCADSGEMIWPMEMMWKYTYWNISGTSPIPPPFPRKRSKFISDESYMMRILQGKA